MAMRSFTAILERENDMYVALCPELDVASQGPSVEVALANLREAVELFLECADPKEVQQRLHEEVFLTRFEAAYG
jgi:predicted RNase H-like HicB family nuclease